MLLLYSFLLCFSIAVPSSHSSELGKRAAQVTDECETIYLLNVVPFPDSGEFSGWDRGLEVIPAGHLAARHINNRSDLLDGKNLTIINVASEACERNANDGFVRSYQKLLSTSCIHGVIGLYCSAVTNMIVPLLNHSQYGYIHLSASTSPSFRNDYLYPYLFRNIASSAVFNKAMIALMESFNWTRVSAIFDSMTFYFKSTGNDFANLVSSSSGKELLATIPILQTDNSIPRLFSIINGVGSRIGYYSVSVEESARILCEAYQQGYLWPSYVYVFHERTVQDILSVVVSCSRKEMLMAMEGTFTLQYRLKTMNASKILVSGMTYEAYYQEYLDELRRLSNEVGMKLDENEYANPLYDQVWAFALALNQSLSNIMVDASFEVAHKATPELRRVLTENLKSLSFEGATGFNMFGTRQEVQTFVDIFQVRKGELHLIGVFNSFNRTLSLNKSKLSDIPEDSFKTEAFLVPTWLSGIVLVAQGILFIATTLNTVLLMYLKKEPEIKSSSFYISLIILAGCYFLCLSPVFYTAYTSFYIPDATAFTILCNLDLWLSINGLSIVFVALLFRLVRVFHVFRTFRSTGKYWADQYLVLYITLACSVAVFLLLVRTATDPLKHRTDTTYVGSSSPPFYLQHAYCSSNLFTLWEILETTWLGLILTLVAFLAIQTRHIKRKHFKDTKKVSILVFCVSATYAACIPLWQILLASDVIIGAYFFKWLAYFVVSLLCQVFLFMPKIYPILVSSTRKSRSKPYASALIRTAVKGTKM